MYARGQAGWPSLVVTLLMTLACLSVALRSDLAWLVVFLWLVVQILPFPVTSSVVPPLLAALLILGCIGAVQGMLAALIASIVYLPALSRGGTTDMPIDAILIQFGFFVLAVGAGIVWGSYQRRTRRERRRASQTYQRNALRVADRLHNSVANDLVYLDRVLAGDKLTPDQIEQARSVLSSALGKGCTRSSTNSPSAHPAMPTRHPIPIKRNGCPVFFPRGIANSPKPVSRVVRCWMSTPIWLGWAGRPRNPSPA